MRVLLISQYLPPLKNISAVRITEVANQFAKNGFDVIGFSTWNHKYELTDKYDLDPRIQIIRSESYDFLIVRMQLKAWLQKVGILRKGTSGSVLTHEGIVNRTRLSRAKSDVFSFLANYLPFSLIFGPGGFIYILVTFFRSIRYVQKDTVVFSTFRPYSDHLIAFLIKIFYPHVTWICDFRDPHLPPNAKGLFYRWHHGLNKIIFRHANVVTTVSNGIAYNLRGYNNNIRILRNGITGTLDVDAVNVPTDKFNIIYTGMLYEGTRDPSALFSILNVMLETRTIDPAKVRLVYAGKDKAIWDNFVRKYNLEVVNQSFGQIPMQEARDLQESASINLLLTWADRNYKGVLTGKMYEYLKARKPIITIVNGERDEEIEEIMTQTGAGPVIYPGSSREKLHDYILSQYKVFETGLTTPAIKAEKLAEFQWDYYFPELLQSLNLVSKHKTHGLKKILVVSYYFPPCNMTPANRVYSWAKYMKEFGYYPVIVTRNWDHSIKTQQDIEVESGNEIIHEKMEGFEVYYLPYNGNFRTRYAGKFNDMNLHVINRVLTFMQLILQNSFPALTPFSNIFRFTRELVKNDSGFSYMLISANPFVLFKLGYQMKKKYGLPWLADYRDDWTTQELQVNKGGLYSLVKSINVWFERKWISNADKIITISDYYASKLQKFHKRKCHKIENGFFEEEFEKYYKTPVSERFTILYSGTMYNAQPLEIFIQGYIQFILNHKVRPLLIFLGLGFNREQSERVKSILKGYEDFYKITDRMPYTTAIKLQQQASVLLMIPYGTLKGIPGSKIYDYIGSRKPVILCPSDNDLIYEMLTKTGQGLFCNTPEAVSTCLSEQYAFPRHVFNETMIEFYTRKHQCELLTKLLEKPARVIETEPA